MRDGGKILRKRSSLRCSRSAAHSISACLVLICSNVWIQNAPIVSAQSTSCAREAARTDSKLQHRDQIEQVITLRQTTQLPDFTKKQACEVGYCRIGRDTSLLRLRRIDGVESDRPGARLQVMTDRPVMIEQAGFQFVCLIRFRLGKVLCFSGIDL